MILSFLLSVSGYLILHRNFRTILEDFALNHILGVAVYLVLAVFSLFLFLTLQDHPVQLWLSFGIFLITLKFFAFFLKNYAKKCIENRMPIFLDSLIAGISCGFSLKQSLHKSVQMESSWVRIYWVEIQKSIEISETSLIREMPICSEFAGNLKNILESNSKQKEQLHFLRKQYTLLLNFRHRSGQLLGSMRYQMIIMCVMYVSLLVFVVTNFGYMQNQLSIFVSTVLFICGISVGIFVQRGIKWNI